MQWTEATGIAFRHNGGMNPPAEQSPPPSPESSWRRQLLVLGLLAFSTTMVFWLTELDIQVSSLFHDPGNPVLPWPHEHDTLWRLFYHGAPLFTGLYALGGVLVILLGIGIKRLHPWRRPAALLLLTLILGPGLLVNMLFKENWGRPRPRQVEQLGGQQPYIPPLLMNRAGNGKSFAAGHASVGFSLCFLWFLWRHKRPRLAWAGLTSAIILGLLMGLGRIASGAHFLSDVLWAGYLTFFVGLMVHFFILGPPKPDTQARDLHSGGNVLALVGYGVLGAALLLGSLLSYPVNERIHYETTPSMLPLPPKLRLELGHAEVYLRMVQNPDTPLKINGVLHGFGLPSYRIESYALKLQEDEGDVLRYRYREQGLFAELNARIDIEVDPTGLGTLHLYLREGNIHLLESRVPPPPRLRLETPQGRVIEAEQRPSAADPAL